MTTKDSNYEDQPTLDGIKRPRGRPKTGKAMTNAERQKAYRQRKAKSNQVALNRYVNEKTLMKLELLEKRGISLDDVVEIAMEQRFGKQTL